MAKGIRKAPPKRGRPGPDGVDVEFGRRIRAYRLNNNVSQMALAEMLGVSFQQVQKYEKGTNKVSAARLADIAVRLHTTPHDLMGWQSTTPMIALTDEDMKLLKVFVKLPEKLKPAHRALIEAEIRHLA
jgi:transcriptional regulator with XRE-family HTH domain